MLLYNSFYLPLTYYSFSFYVNNLYIIHCSILCKAPRLGRFYPAKGAIQFFSNNENNKFTCTYILDGLYILKIILTV